jgi:hypothetical protein
MIGGAKRRLSSFGFNVLSKTYIAIYSSPKSFVDFWVCGSGRASTNHLGLLYKYFIYLSEVYGLMNIQGN